MSDAFYYAYRNEMRPSPSPREETLTRKCVDCDAEFTTGSRVQKRCDKCRPLRRARLVKQCNARLQAKRRSRAR
jgi:hypothetical protein